MGINDLLYIMKSSIRAERDFNSFEHHTFIGLKHLKSITYIFNFNLGFSLVEAKLEMSKIQSSNLDVANQFAA